MQGGARSPRGGDLEVAAQEGEGPTPQMGSYPRETHLPQEASRTMNSTRRFFSLPSGVPLSAMGLSSP